MARIPRHMGFTSLYPSCFHKPHCPTWGEIKFATNQTHEAPGGSQATNRTVNNAVDQNEPEKPKSQHSQDQSNPASLHENQTQSRPGSHHSQQAPSRPATHESQGELRPPTRSSRPASQQK
ncbi:hypothetical protein M9458_046483 [Cirrhinus mrigala]|uniref:Uncharacterized protein n=1 Tax=Cirrhinus mrigala TaxID=683832 RepID=A0ABD0N9Z5_CIRMR